MKIIYTSTKSQVKSKLKPKAERNEYAAWCSKYGIDPDGKTRRAKKPLKSISVFTSGIVPRETKKYPSLNTSANSTAPVPRREYTGDKIVGIAAMHKSNLVPIFNDDAAKDVASMRR